MSDASPGESSDAQLGSLERSLSYTFRDRDWLRLALSHRSAPTDDLTHSSRTNERLEFLGDAVLDLAIRTFLFGKYPDAQEGLLTQWRSQLAGRENLAAVAEGLRLHEHMRHDLGNCGNNPAQRERLLADGVEALLGAVYCDADYTGACRVAQSLLGSSFEELPSDPRAANPKAALQEWWQSAYGRPPRYELASVAGPGHAPHFTMAALLGDRRGETGSGWSKREASRNAARATLDRLEREPEWKLEVARQSATLSSATPSLGTSVDAAGDATGEPDEG
jgi:ribonuclease-3